MRYLYILPLVGFIVLAGFLLVGLNRDPHEVPSPLINKAAPAFTLPQLKDPAKTFSAQEMREEQLKTVANREKTLYNEWFL